MAGPCASVFSACESEAADRALADLIRKISNPRRGRDFWVCDTTLLGGTYGGEGRPFFWRLSPRHEWGEEPNAYERMRLEELLGAAPSTRLGFCAMCNDGEDHRILGELCIAVARSLGGIIRFDGLLQPWRMAAEWERWRHLPAQERAARFLAEVGTGGGRLVAFGLDADDAPSCHYGDVRFLEHWLAHPKFRMVK